jgi:predicted NBD/HSP70 family sugar kinase
MPSLASSAPGSTSTLRVANRRRVLDLLRSGLDGRVGEEHGAYTQAAIARTTGLAPATVSNIVRDLAATGLVAVDPGSGRRGSSVRLAPSAGTVAGVDFGHSHVAVAVGDLTGQILAEERRPLASVHHHAEVLAVVAEMLQALSAGHSDVRHVGLGLPAPVTDEVVRSASIFPGWDGVNARQVAEARLGTPVSVENDANLGALAEHRQGVGRGHDSSVFVKISSGVGAGIVLDNRLYHGSGGTAGEIGHLTLDDQGPLCRCGSRGCLEAYTSSGPVLEMMAAQLPGADLDDIFAAAQHGNIAAQRALEDAGLHLGWALASIVNLINPAVVVVGGDMARAGEALLASARVGLRRHALDSVAMTPVLGSHLGERASLVGAVLLAAEKVELVSDAD